MNRYALIIGISQYRHFPSLPQSATSAEAVAQLLKAHGKFQDVRPLPMNWVGDRYEVGRDLRLTKTELMTEIKRLLNEQAQDGVALLYFSGHGFVVPDDAIEGRFEAYLATSDTEIGVEAGQVVWAKNGISLRSLARLFANAKVSSLVVLLDCCHSGSLVEFNDIFQQALAANSTSSKVYIITACRDFEKAYAGSDGSGYTVFTAALLAGLHPDRAEHGQVITDRLFANISETMGGTGQEPKRLGLADPIAIVTYPNQPTPTPTNFNPANPYVGLAAFESSQADYFFGRSDEIRALLERLDPLQKPSRRFLAVIGPSGSGKSSVVKAGLIPALAKDALPGSSQWQIERLKPGAYPLTVLNGAIAQYTDAQPHVLVVDQFEELFTLCQSEEEQREFLALLNQQVTNGDRQARVVITMRSDFLDRCIRYPETAELINKSQPTTFAVSPLTDDKLAAQLGQAIVEPATRHGVEFQPGLAAQMSADVRNQLGAMPLLQYALMELWKFCIPNESAEPCLTWAGYEAIGGVRGALQRRADSLYVGLTASNQILLRDLVMELVQVGELGEVSRRRAQREELWALAPKEQVDRLLEQLTVERFLVVDGQTVEVAHEALLSEAPQIRAWIEENRENLRLRDRFERDCREWQEQERSPVYLLNPGKLAAVEDWIATTNPNLSEVESEFVGESVRKRDRETQAQLEQERRLREAAEARVKAERQKTRIAVISGISLAVLAAVAGLSAIWAQAETRNAQISEVKALTATAEALDAAPNQLGALVATVKALKEIRRSRMQVPEALQKIISQTHEYNRLEGHTLSAIDADFSSSGNIIGSTSVDRTVRLWRKNGQPIKANFPDCENGVWGIDISSKDQLVVTGCIDGVVRVFDIEGNLKQELKPLGWKAGILNFNVVKVRFSFDDSMIVSAHRDGQVRLWRVSDGKLLKTFPHLERVYGVDFSPKADLIVSGSWDKSVKVWKISDAKPFDGKRFDGKPLHEFRHKDRVHEVTFDLSGDRVASASWDETVRIWSVKTGEELSKLVHKYDVYGISFSPDGKTIASGSTDRVIRLWDVDSEKLINQFKGHTAPINAVNFSPDGKLLVSTSDDWTVRIWSLTVAQGSSAEANDLLQSSCNWLQSYLRYNLKVKESERQVCDNILYEKSKE